MGFELFGWRPFGGGEDAEAVIADPQRYAVTEAINAPNDLAGVIRNASSLVADQGGPASGAAGLIAKARGDYRRITAALYGEGYYGGTISIRIEGQEAANLAPDISLPDPARVDVIVDPGPLFRFSQVRIVNEAPFTNDPDDQVLPVSEIGYAAGEVARSTVIQRAETLALEAWRQQGFALAEITGREIVADHASQTVLATITVAPGPRAGFGPIAVIGTERMDPEFVARQTGIAPGEEYDPDTLRTAQRRIDRLEVFRSARFEAATSVGADGLLPYSLIVDEQAGRRFGFGASYGTIDGLGLEAYHLWRNLFGQAERLRLDARVASIAFPIDTAQFDYFFGGTFTKPGFLTPDTDLVAAISAERTVVPRYKETSALARLGLSHFVSDVLTVEGGASYEIARFDDDFGTRDFQTTGVYGIATFDNRDDPLDATEGFYASGTFEPFYELNYGNFGLRTILEGRAYYALLGDDQLVLAGRLRAGALLGPSLAEIPPDRLFFAGGGGSVRGYGFRSIGVDGPGGIVTGGRYLLEASLEARAKVTEDIGVVGFLDGGYVAADTFPSLDQLRLGAGVGLRYETGLGPLRLDVAIPLNRRPGDPSYAIYAGIGQAF
jgi:translocation and assembly module TamA